MGNWHISIQGIGAHHNRDYPSDANKMMERFVRELAEAGHRIDLATFTYGGMEGMADIARAVEEAKLAALRS